MFISLYMNNTIKRFFQQIFLNDFIWQMIAPFVWLSERVKASRINYKEAPLFNKWSEKARQIFYDKIVRNGPFKGMYFGEVNPKGSSYFAKLLGSYETEIHPFIMDAITHAYTNIINIGCDEGYYAVGLGLKIPGAAIQAFDAVPLAIKNCKALATLNKIEERMSYGGRYTEKEALQHDPKKRALFVVDCEGDERNIFTEAAAQKLYNADIIVELHLHIDPYLVEHFEKLFSTTHEMALVNSVDDHLKAQTYDWPELKGLDYPVKRFITEERSVFMQWIYLKSKKAFMG